MKKKLKYKFIGGFLLFGLLGFLLISTVASDAVLAYLVSTRAEILYERAESISEDYVDSYKGNMQPLSDKRNEYSGLANGLSSVIWIADSQGLIIYDSTYGSTGKTITDFEPANFGKATLSTPGFSEIGTFYNMLPKEHLSVMAPIHLNYQTRGYIIIHMPMSLLELEQYNILNVVYLVGLALFILSFIFLLIYQRYVSRPLGEIIHAADAYASGNLKYKCSVSSNDEMGYLAATLNLMASELNNTEEYQKSFISNVSHDFRSPLTSIRGYLVAILDGTIPPELYEKYINIVINETERLNKLTEGLLLLNQLGSDHKVGLNLSTFDINGIIKATCATFEGRCRSKNLNFNLTFSDKTMMVQADMGKIQQVIYNLVDNAIKFSNPQSEIDIETYDRNGKVFVSVKDHGCGISKEQQKKIFERFYKADNSRGKDKQGTGLGLAIVKEILNAHGQNIDVISTPGVGTEFIFTVKQG